MEESRYDAAGPRSRNLTGKERTLSFALLCLVSL